MRKIGILSLGVVLAASWAAMADGPKDNQASDVRPIPPRGIELPAETRGRLEEELARLGQALENLQGQQDLRIRSLIPDVEIYHRAVRDALDYEEFFAAADVDAALELLRTGRERAEQLARGEAPWTEATGLVVRGYVSRIDGSVQPYGLVVPESYTHRTPGKYRLDIWFHGRGEKLSEVNFIAQRTRQIGEFAPADTIVLHPYGRYCNAFKFAGEVDVLEALDSVRGRYRVDDNRTSVRGFSMGGAACWQFAVHYADRWFAANPGAGFSETPEFLKFFQKETLAPTWYEEKLWSMYDCNRWARNLLHCPTVAYSGEIDVQKQAADVMEQALAEQGVQLTHVIGPQTAHRYHPEAKATVTSLLDHLAEKGRNRLPRRVSLTTYTLKYNQMHWVTLDGLEEHWRAARVEAEIASPTHVRLTTENATDITLVMPAGWAPLSLTQPIQVTVDDQNVGDVRAKSDRSWTAQLHREDGAWKLGPRENAGLRKGHNLQGPIDDALMDSFIFVRPTGKAWHETIGSWSAGELDRAIDHWRRHFRGHAEVKDDTQIDAGDIASANLILWGDPSSNAILRRIAGQLPIAWEEKQIMVGERRFPAEHHALIAIYPNPLNPERYVVLNSSFTFREYAYLNNARQVPKLPDWAIVDVRTPPDALWPGKIADADFFDEAWRLQPAHKEP